MSDYFRPEYPGGGPVKAAPPPPAGPLVPTPPARGSRRGSRGSRASAPSSGRYGGLLGSLPADPLTHCACCVLPFAKRRTYRGTARVIRSATRPDLCQLCYLTLASAGEIRTEPLRFPTGTAAALAEIWGVTLAF